VARDLAVKLREQGLMAAVHAIEVADGEHAAVVGALGNSAEYLHGLEAEGKAGDYIKLGKLHRVRKA
jgi:hypothetical protein